MQDLFVKICGITNLSDAKCAIDCRADALGFVFDKGSPSYITPDKCAEIIASLPGHISKVGVFSNADLKYVHDVLTKVNLSAVQLDGKEGADDLVNFETSVIKVFHVHEDFDVEVMRSYIVDAFLVDAHETRRSEAVSSSFYWHTAVRAKEFGKIILSGGLNPDNIEGAVRFVKPYGVNVCRGVESEPGYKDHNRVCDFVARAKGVYLSDIDEDFIE